MRERVLPSPPSPDQRAWEVLLLEVSIAIESSDGRYEFTPEADAYYADFYRATRQDFESDATSRTHLHARKLGLMYAILAGRGDRLVHPPDIESGAEVAKYCARIVEPIVESLDASPRRRLEQRLVARITDTPGAEKRDLYRALHTSVSELSPVLASLVEAGMIREREGRYYAA